MANTINECSDLCFGPSYQCKTPRKNHKDCEVISCHGYCDFNDKLNSTCSCSKDLVKIYPYSINDIFDSFWIKSGIGLCSLVVPSVCFAEMFWKLKNENEKLHRALKSLNQRIEEIQKSDALVHTKIGSADREIKRLKESLETLDKSVRQLSPNSAACTQRIMNLENEFHILAQQTRTLGEVMQTKLLTQYF
jgi:uncharacterized phage infection (PIP) family protein YhgE